MSEEQGTQEAAHEVDTQASASVNMGLVDVAQEGQEAPEPDSDAEPNGDYQSTQWQWMDGVNGDGDKPEWLQERYKSVADQAKAYNELEKKMGEFRGAPKDGYKLDIEGLPKDDPLISHFSETFKELNLTQQGFERVVQEFMQLQNQQAELNGKAELEKLGPNGKQIVNEVINQVNNTFNDDVAKTIQGMMITANDVKAVQAMLSLKPSTNSPTHNQMQQTIQRETVKEIDNEKLVNWDRYQEDVNYRNALQRRRNAAAAYEDAIKKAK